MGPAAPWTMALRAGWCARPVLRASGAEGTTGLVCDMRSDRPLEMHAADPRVTAVWGARRKLFLPYFRALDTTADEML